MSGYLGHLAGRLKRLLAPPPYPLDPWRRQHPTCVFMDGCAVSRSTFGRHVSVLAGARLDRVDIQDFSYVSYASTVIAASIGRFCSIGQDVHIGLGRHPARDFVSTYPGFYAASNTGCARPFRNDTVFDQAEPPTRIGHDVWIGSHVIIPGGITIGTGAIVAAGAVVVKDVAPYEIVGGNPAAPIRSRFEPDVVRQLLASAWWDWPLERLERSVGLFADAKAFLAALEEKR
jgi:acetyltransferase-like isoleucine patch superfamily enzyme